MARGSWLISYPMPPFTPSQTFTLFVTLATLLGVAFGRLPGLPLNRAATALVGASALLAAGVLDLHGAWRLIDGETSRCSSR